MTVPSYVDISHFRAPYENAAFGQPPPPATGPPGPLAPGNGGGVTMEQFAGQMMDKKEGVWYWKPGAADAIMKMLENYATIFIGGPTERVEIRPYHPLEIQAMTVPVAGQEQAVAMLRAINARKWVVDKLEEKKVVFAPVWLGSPVDNREMAAIPASDKDRVREAASTPMVGILAQPAGFSIAGLSVTTLAIAGVVIIGGAMLLMGTKKKGGGSKSFAA